MNTTKDCKHEALLSQGGGHVNTPSILATALASVLVVAYVCKIIFSCHLFITRNYHRDVGEMILCIAS